MQKQKKAKIGILVTGCGRCGTKYMSALLRSLGFDVRHERMGRDGIASWYVAAGIDNVPIGPGCQNYDFEHIIHVVRNPLHAIPSMAYLSNEAWEFICQHIDCSPDEPTIARGAKYWYYWNKKAEQLTSCFVRLEDVEQIADVLAKRLKISVDLKALSMLPKNINSRRFSKSFHWTEEFLLRLGMYKTLPMLKNFFSIKHQTSKLTFEVLNEQCSELAPLIFRKATQYGYCI